MRPGSDGSFNAIDVADQIGFTNEANGNGRICTNIQTAGTRIVTENRFSSCPVDVSSASAPLTAAASITAATSASACCAKPPFAMIRDGIAANNMVRRDEATDNM